VAKLYPPELLQRNANYGILSFLILLLFIYVHFSIELDKMIYGINVVHYIFLTNFDDTKPLPASYATSFTCEYFLHISLISIMIVNIFYQILMISTPTF
jgi:hypothetical protein